MAGSGGERTRPDGEVVDLRHGLEVARIVVHRLWVSVSASPALRKG
jgi:hypothetical protein